MTDTTGRRAQGFGTATALFVVVSSTVGTGVLTTSGYVGLAVGSNAVMLVLWLAGGVTTLCGALTLAEISTRVRRSGGEFAIFEAAYGPGAAALAGWVSLWLGFAAPIAATASAAAAYLTAPFGPRTGHGERVVIGAAAIAAWAAVHSLGARRAPRLQGVLTALTIGVLAAFAVAGFATAPSWTWLRLLDRPLSGHIRWGRSIGALVYVAYAYTGWNAAAYLAGEVRDPRRTLPRALLGGTALVVVLYCALNIVYALAITPAELAGIAERQGREAVEPVAELAAERLFGRVWAVRLSGVVGVMLLGSLGALVLTGPRVASAMADSGRVPAWLGLRGGSHDAPWAATLALSAAAIGMLATGSFEAIVVFSGIGLGVFSLATVAAVFALRSRGRDSPDIYRCPGHPLPAVVFLAVTAALVVAASYEAPRSAFLSLLVIDAGVPFALKAARGGTGRVA